MVKDFFVHYCAYYGKVIGVYFAIFWKRLNGTSH